MRPRDRASRVLLLIVTIVGFSTTTAAPIADQQPDLLILLIFPAEPVKNVGCQIPQMEIQLPKDHVSSNDRRYYVHEYKQTGQDYDAKTTLANDEKKISNRVGADGTVTREHASEDEESDIVMPDSIPQIGFRNIIRVPSFCPEGERMDSNNVCRPEIID